MGVMDVVRKMSGNNSEFKSRFKDAQEEQKIQHLLEERSKSANRRELEKIIKQREEDEIKTELDKIRKQENKDNWKSPNMILKKDKSILKDDRPILKEKNIFKMKHTKSKGGMFFN